MRRFTAFWPFAFWLVAISASMAQTGGVTPDWEIRDAAAALQKHTKVVDDLLKQLKPEEWAKQGGPGLYGEQWKQAKEFNTYLGTQAEGLAANPAKLSLVIDVFLRIEHLQPLLDSLTGGIRAYQNSPLADLLASAIGQNAATREKLKEYTRELAVEREKEWDIANEEAQRRRAILVKRPATKAAPKAAPKKAEPAKP